MTITFMSVTVVTCTQPPGSNSIRLENIGTTSGEVRVKIDAGRKKQFEKRSRCLLMNIFGEPPTPHPLPTRTPSNCVSVEVMGTWRRQVCHCVAD